MNLPYWRTAFIFSLFVFLLTSLSGCGRNAYVTATVTGEVLCNGKPAVGGVVVFTPIDDSQKTGRPAGKPGRPATGLVGVDGKFRLTLSAAAGEHEKAGALVGPHEVTFRMPRTEPPELSQEDLRLPPAELAKLRTELEKLPVYEPLSCGSTIDQKTVEVKSGSNVFKFTLLAETPEEKKQSEDRKERIGRRKKRFIDTPANDVSHKE